MVEVVHGAVSVGVEENVSRIPKHVTAELGSTGSVTTAFVVLGSPESAHHSHSADVDSAGG